MQKILLGLIASAGCWSSAAPSPSPAPATGNDASPASANANPCREAGDRLVLVVCPREHDVAWTVTNKTADTLWVFVAPPAWKTRTTDRANAFVEARGGAIVLHKIQLSGGDEPVFTGAVALAPGASDEGVVPLGADFDPDAPNVFPVSRDRTHIVRHRIDSVALEVGFAVQLPTDRPRPPDARTPFFELALATGRQQLVASPPLRWR